ncbi:unnamed protein product [Timema podura]|uniref:protein-tyrosine-phosphatase n=1 Tax=Timema podura TaxID=61482 RepID=A0ABN7NR94_TIMPD|nr:unnamed protein product [Timema podura]
MSEEGVTKKRTGSEKHKGASANLERDDFGAGPTNLDCIEPGLWLGNITAATDDVALEQRRINHILTVDSCPLPRKMVMQQGIKTLFIQVTDTPREDLLSHFEDTYRFISEGQERGVVLVHCYFGVSRSATIVIAYMMKKHGLSFEDALERYEDVCLLHGRVVIINSLVLKPFSVATFCWRRDAAVGFHKNIFVSNQQTASVSPALGRYEPQLSPGTQSRCTFIIARCMHANKQSCPVLFGGPGGRVDPKKWVLFASITSLSNPAGSSHGEGLWDPTPGSNPSCGCTT